MKFKITKANDSSFESGLRGFFEYKNLGIEEATSGDFGANVIKAVDGKHANGEWHYHKLTFQMVYILKGSVEFEYKGEGTFILEKGDVVYQPSEIHHREIKHSDDLELIEITSPAEFETITISNS
jgi:quercetin dioxygenase-like cupin family protein|tara:strand:- start:185 stop:559 length:375 start_codon:yes stop_codon:yes gene_type:complete